jgi:uncharacterized FAD-dependent dehydrogenase
MPKNDFQMNRHNAETALINALALLRNGDTEQALTLTIVAVGRIGALVPTQVAQRVGASIGEQMAQVGVRAHD